MLATSWAESTQPSCHRPHSLKQCTRSALGPMMQLAAKSAQRHARALFRTILLRRLTSPAQPGKRWHLTRHAWFFHRTIPSLRATMAALSDRAVLAVRNHDERSGHIVAGPTSRKGDSRDRGRRARGLRSDRDRTRSRRDARAIWRLFGCVGRDFGRCGRRRSTGRQFAGKRRRTQRRWRGHDVGIGIGRRRWWRGRRRNGRRRGRWTSRRAGDGMRRDVEPRLRGQLR
jgi:hypothetical protein